VISNFCQQLSEEKEERKDRNMATLDDKLMGEKLHYYCSSSEDEDEPEPPPQGADGQPLQRPTPGQGPQTGPKGVIEDWRRFKQLETEKRQDNERERVALCKKLALTCRSEREDKEADTEVEKLEQEIENEDDDFLKEYMKKRMQEMVEASVINRKHFGHVFDLISGDQFLHTVDHPEHKNVLMIIHIWEANNEACKAVDGCLQSIAKDYSHVKFARIQASAAGLSQKFKISGVPALLVYRSGELVSRFVRLSDTLGEDFYASDLESFLIENGVLSDAKLMPSIIRSSQRDSDQDSD